MGRQGCTHLRTISSILRFSDILRGLGGHCKEVAAIACPKFHGCYDVGHAYLACMSSKILGRGRPVIHSLLGNRIHRACPPGYRRKLANGVSLTLFRCRHKIGLELGP